MLSKKVQLLHNVTVHGGGYQTVAGFMTLRMLKAHAEQAEPCVSQSQSYLDGHIYTSPLCFEHACKAPSTQQGTCAHHSQGL